MSDILTMVLARVPTRLPDYSIEGGDNSEYGFGSFRTVHFWWHPELVYSIGYWSGKVITLRLRWHEGELQHQIFVDGGVLWRSYTGSGDAVWDSVEVAYRAWVAGLVVT